jgi:hypothetical protein
MKDFSYSLNKVRVALILISIVISLGSCVYFFHLGLTNIYGDAIAHLNIARKLVDLDTNSFWVRYVQLGSPWLPLPHLLMLPFVWNDYLWRTGLAGSIVSMICYVLTTEFIFEIGIIFGKLYFEKEQKCILSGILAASIFALNPSVLYLQTTAMTELPFLTTFTAAVFFLVKWNDSQSKKYLIISAIFTILATITRYEAWAILPAASLTILLVTPGSYKEKLKLTLLWGFIGSLGIFYWLWHNWAIYGNALEFYNGFYSAKGIYLRQEARLGWANFTVGHIWLASLLALAATMACSGLVCLLWLASLVKITFSVFSKKRKAFIIGFLPIALLAIPFLFMIYSLYTGNIQIYPLSAISLLNVRYGINSIIAIAVFSIVWINESKKAKLLIVFLLVFSNYIWLISAGVNQLAVVQEPYRNNFNIREAQARKKLAKYLLTHPPASKIMIYSGDLGPVITSGGLKFKNTVFEGISPWNTDNKVPDVVKTVVVKEGDQLWEKLQTIPSFSQDFKLVYEVGPNPRMMVWQRVH